MKGNRSCVNENRRATFCGKINLASQPYPNANIRYIEEVENQDGSITFRAKLIEGGMSVSIR